MQGISGQYSLSSLQEDRGVGVRKVKREYAPTTYLSAPVPLRELLVSLLPSYVKHQDANVSLVIVARVHGVEALLARRIPKVHLRACAIVELHILPEKSQSVRGVLQGGERGRGGGGGGGGVRLRKRVGDGRENS